jgi:hypothetical protein
LAHHRDERPLSTAVPQLMRRRLDALIDDIWKFGDHLRPAEPLFPLDERDLGLSGTLRPETSEAVRWFAEKFPICSRQLDLWHRTVDL